jgi:hypothetical protein
MIVIYLLYLYLTAGFLSAIWLIWLKKSHLNANMPMGVKLIIMPGCILLWPVVLFKSFSL